jgi:hypothetical protein
MRRDTHPTGHPISEETNVAATEADASLWAFFPILIGAAAICLVIFFFITPSFEAAGPVPARSARPGAETLVTRGQSETTETTTEGLKVKNSPVLK